MDSFDIRSEPVRGTYPDLAFLGLPGSERIRAGASGLMPAPPIHHLMGLRPTGEAEFEMPSSPWLQSSAGVFLAGTTALVADAPFGSAIIRALPPGVWGTTSELSMSFLRPAGVHSGTLTSSAELIDVGRTLGLSQAVVTDERGRLLAHGTSRYVLLRVDPVPTPPPLEPIEPPTFDTPDPYQRPVDGSVLPADVLQTRPGIEILRACMSDELPQPPFSHLFGMRIADVGEGTFAVRAPASPWMTSPAATIYGGIIAYIADNVMAGALWSTLPAGRSLAPLDLKVNFLRPGLPDGRDMFARATVVHRGRRIAVTQAEILNADGKQLAIALGSSMIIERGWDPDHPAIVADEAGSE